MSIAQRPLVTRGRKPKPASRSEYADWDGTRPATTARIGQRHIPVFPDAYGELKAWHDANHTGVFDNCEQEPCHDLTRYHTGLISVVMTIERYHFRQDHPYSTAFCDVEPCKSVMHAAQGHRLD